MIDRVVRGFAAGAGLDVEEMLDVLWLSAAYPRSQAGQVSPDGTPASTQAGSPAKDAGEGPADPENLPLDTESWADRGADSAPMTAVGLDAPRPLRRVATLPMAVRRLRKVVAPSPQPVVDIEATVEATADASAGSKRWLVPVLTRPPQRALDLALVVDDSRSMRIWGDVFDDLERLLAQTSAFRSVSRWRLSAEEGTIRPHTRQRDGDGSSQLIQRPEQLVDPSVRRLVLVGTDARDRSWYSEAPWDALATWCAAMPTVLVHMLPQQYWGNTAVGAPYMTSRALTPAAPNAQYKHRLAWWIADEDPGGPPLPVVTLTEKSLDTWSQSIVNGTAWTIGITATPPDPGSAPEADGPVEVAVNDFLAKATPGAQRLARILASTDAELSLPLISVLRERLAPETGVAELAEILASGLLTDIEPAGNGGPQQLRYRTGAREILCRGTTVFEGWDAFATVDRYLKDHQQVNGPLKVKAPAPAGSPEHDLNDKSFHDFHRAMAVHFGLRPDGPGGSAPEHPDAGQEHEAEPGLAKEQDNELRGDSEALRDALAAEIAGLGESEDDEFKVASFAADGITVWRVARDENGTPQGQRLTLMIEPVIDPEDFYTSRLAPSLGDSRLLISVGALDESRAAVLRLLRAANGAFAYDCHKPFEDLLHQAIDSTPLTRWYDLVVLSETADRRLRIDTQPLFQPGATSGDQTEPFRMRCGPADDLGTAFTVIARRSGSEPFRPDQSRPVQAQSGVVPPGTYRVSALLSRPGSVHFDGLPARLSADKRPLARLIRQVPERLRMPVPVHLACLIEVSGDEGQLRRRIDRLEQLITTAADGAEQELAVSVISYGPHSVERGVREDPATVQARATSPARAVRVLRGLASRRAPAREYERAAQTECALNELCGLLDGRPGGTGRLVVVTAGERPPHPPRLDIRSEIIPCHNRADWRAMITRLRRVPGIRFGALCDPDAVGDIWRALGRDAFGRLNSEGVIPGFARDLGLLEGIQAVPFPLLEPAERAAPRRAAPARVSTATAQLVVLGPPGSGRTTFLGVLNLALNRRYHGLTLAGADEPSMELLISATERLVRDHEFPRAAAGNETFQGALSGPASSAPQLTQGGAIESTKAAQRPVQLALDIAGPSREIAARTEGILIMFDPIRELERRDAFTMIDDFLRRVTWEFKPGSSSGSEKLPHHVAVCVTKFDDARVLDAATRLKLVTTDPLDPLRFPRVNDSDAREFFVKLSGMRGHNGGERLVARLNQVFHEGRVQFFVTSAIGFYVDPRTGRFDPDDTQNFFTPAAEPGTTRIRDGIRPINVVEPILWLADRIAAT
jgi:hypothetical protein